MSDEVLTDYPVDGAGGEPTAAPGIPASRTIIRLREIVWLMVTSAIVQIAIFVPVQDLNASRFTIVNVSVSAGSLWWLVSYRRLARSRGLESLRDRFSPVAGRLVLVSALFGVGIKFLPLVLLAVLSLVGVELGDLDFPAQALIPTTLRQLPLAIAGIVVLGPLSEELIFRGLLLDWCRQRMAVWQAVLVTSLLFAFLHDMNFKYGVISGIVFVARFALGLGASWLAIRYRSLRVPFVMHATFNGCACLASVLGAGG